METKGFGDYLVNRLVCDGYASGDMFSRAPSFLDVFSVCDGVDEDDLYDILGDYRAMCEREGVEPNIDIDIDL